MHPRRTPLTLFATTAAAVVLVVGLGACQPAAPAKGQADIKASGWINGSARGPKVTCTATSKVNTRTWTGTLGGRKNVEVSFEMNKVTGRDWVKMSWSIPGGGQGVTSSDDKDIVTVDSAKVARFSGRVGGSTQYVDLTAALVCP